MTLTESGVEARLRCVIRTREQWAAFRALAVQAAPPDSAADLAREMLLAVSMGFRGNTGYEIGIERVLARADTLAVSVMSTSPGPGLENDMVLTPLQVMRVPRSAGPVLWIERSRQR